MTARNEEIESLRAIAILLTLFQHLPILLPWPSPPDWMTFIYDHAAFWGGVDLFFVISGFVVTTSLLNDAHGKAGEGSAIAWADAKRFWVRRLFRLLPLAWVWVGVVLLATAAFNDSGVFGMFRENLSQAMWIVLYVYNWFAYPLFAAGVNIAPLGVYWSLAVEEQFYLLLPLLLLAFRRRGMLILMTIAIAGQFMLWRPAPWVEPWWGLRFDALAWGVLLAWLVRTPWHGRWLPDWLGTLSARWGVNALLMGAILLMPVFLFKQAAGTALLAIVCAGWVWLATWQQGFVLPAKRLQPVLSWLGSRSYAIYVIHVPAFMLSSEIFFRLARAQGTTSGWTWAPAQAFAGLAMLLVLAELSHRLLEQPLRAYGRRLAEKIK